MFHLTPLGDLMGPSLANIDSLLKMPYGCGEQNMLNFAPNIFIMQYLTAIDRLKDDIKEKATEYTLQGIQLVLCHFGISDSLMLFMLLSRNFVHDRRCYPFRRNKLITL